LDAFRGDDVFVLLAVEVAPVEAFVEEIVLGV
jgi:hypothetical protein